VLVPVNSIMRCSSLTKVVVFSVTSAVGVLLPERIWEAILCGFVVGCLWFVV
jgi:hypothetical protein